MKTKKKRQYLSGQKGQIRSAFALNNKDDL